MTDTAYRIGAIAVFTFTLTLQAPATASLARQGQAEILCLPRGAERPRPCIWAKTGSTIAVDTSGVAGGRPLTVAFVGARNSGIRVPLGRQPLSLDGSYLLTVPSRLCSGNRLGNFEIQVLTSDLQNSGATRKLASLPVRC